MILNLLYNVSDRQGEMDGVGGAGAGGAEEGIEVKWECVSAGMR